MEKENMSQRWSLLLGALAILFLLHIFSGCAPAEKDPHILTVGIIQTDSHPALDQVRDGFINELKKQMNGQIWFITQNAEGSHAKVKSIAQAFHANQQIDGVFAIATPAAQAIAAVEATKPVFYAAVTDPKKAGLNKPNFCGITDSIDIRKQIDLLIALVPKAKKIAILFNSDEVNSAAVKDHMKAALELRGLEAILISFSKPSEIEACAILACKKSDVILIPTDNSLAKDIQTVAKITRSYKRPLIVSDNLLVEKGALAARGIDYQDAGKKAASLAYNVFINKKQPKDIPTGAAEQAACVVNADVLKDLDISLPHNYNEKIVLLEKK